MTAYASLLNIDMNLPERLISFVGYSTADEQLEFEGETMKYIVDNDTYNFLRRIIERIEYVFETFSEEEVESFIQACISVLYTSQDDSQSNDSTHKTIDHMIMMITSSTSHPRSRIKALLALFNLVFEVEKKYDLLQALSSYALSTKNAKLITHFHSRLDGWIMAWKLEVPKARNLYQLFSELLHADNKGSLSLIYLIKYFDTFSGERIPTEVEAVAITAVLSAIKSPVSSFTDRTALYESFRKQSVTGDLGLLVRLLDIICTGKLSNFNEFESSNAYFLSRYDIDPSSIRYNIRLMTLCALGCEKTNLSYKEISSSLDIEYDEEQVEGWIVDAVGQGLMHAQIDQMNSMVCITRSAHRSFGMDQWKILHDKLKIFRSNVSTVLEAVMKHA